jgi:hypothetical protein
VQFAGGRLLIADGLGMAVRSVDPKTGWLVTPAGTGPPGSLPDGLPLVPFFGDGGPATAAPLADPCGATADPAGNLVIADTANNRVRVVAAASGTFYGHRMRAGDIYTIAGTSRPWGICGNNRAPGFCPVSVAADRHGNLVVADTGEQDQVDKPALVRVIAGHSGVFYGRRMTVGHMYVVAGGALTASGDGGPALKAGLGTSIGQVRPDHAGNLVIADDDRVRVVAVRSGTFYGIKMKALHIYTVAGGGTNGLGDGGPAVKASFNTQGVAVDGAGNLVIGDYGNDRIRVVAVRSGTFYGIKMKARDIYTVAGNGHPGFTGDGGRATSASLFAPGPVAVDSAGNLVEAEFSNRVRVVAVRSGIFYGVKMKALHIYTVAGTGARPGFSGDGGPATSAELSHPGGLAVDAAGNVVIADGRVMVVAASQGTFYGQHMKAGHIYTVACGGTGGPGDGGPATRAGSCAGDVAVDGAGNLMIADGALVRVVATRSGTFYGQAMTAGDIYTIAGGGTGGLGDGGPATKAELGYSTWVATDHAGNVVIGDYINSRVRVVAAASGTFYGQAMTAGDIYTVAGGGTGGLGDGGPATQAGLTPYGHVAADDHGNLIIPDAGNDRVRVVAAASGTFYGQAMTVGHIYTVAGDGTTGFRGDGGPALKAEIWDPFGTAVDPAGNLLINDYGNNRVRAVAVTSGTFYGQAMTAGNIYTIAGVAGFGFFSGDGGPATKAGFYAISGIITDPAGTLLISDSGNGRIRAVTP